MNAPDLHTLSGAYAADALLPDERAAFEGHLADCEVCAREAAEFTATLARLAAADTAAVPAGAEDDAMAAIGGIRQLPPGPDPAPRPGSGPGTALRRLSRLRPRGLRDLALAACLALALLFGGIAVQQHGQARDSRAEAVRLHTEIGRIGALLTAPDAQTATGRTSTGSGTGTVVWADSRNEAAFLADDLPTLRAGTTYELWFADDGAYRPAGLLPASDGSLVLDGPLDQASGVGVTVEPATGSEQPTGEPILLLPLG